MHQSQTDFTFLNGKLVSRIFSARGTLDPYKGLDITSRAALAFLQRHLSTARGGGHVGRGFGRARELPRLQGAAGRPLPPWAWVWRFPSRCTKLLLEPG